LKKDVDLQMSRATQKMSNMILNIIKTEKQYEDLLNWIDLQFDLYFSPESREGQQLQMVLLLIKQYEDEHYQIPPPAHIEIVN